MKKLSPEEIIRKHIESDKIIETGSMNLDFSKNNR